MAQNIQATLKEAQDRVKLLGQKREKLNLDAREQEVHSKQAIAQLKALGYEDAESMTPEQLTALRDETQAKLNEQIALLQQELATADAVVREYEAATI